MPPGRRPARRSRAAGSASRDNAPAHPPVLPAKSPQPRDQGCDDATRPNDEPDQQPRDKAALRPPSAATASRPRPDWTYGKAQTPPARLRSRNGPTASPPRYGLIVTASASEPLERAGSVSLRRVADVVALGIEDHHGRRRSLADQCDRVLQRLPAHVARHLIERRLRLVRANQIGGRFDDRGVEREDVVGPSPGRLRVETDADQRFRRIHGRGQSLGEGRR